MIELELAMPVQRILGHPFAGAIRERVAIQRGPLVYCLEGCDNPAAPDPVLPANAQFQEIYRQDLLGGVVVITADDSNGIPLTAIPYFAWDNRPVTSAAQDWLVVWLRQEDWFALRQPVDGTDRHAWEHVLYQPLP